MCVCGGGVIQLLSLFEPGYLVAYTVQENVEFGPLLCSSELSPLQVSSLASTLQ